MNCPFCNAEYKTLMALRIHILKSHKLDRCPACNKKFKNLKTHISKHDDEEHQKLYAILGRNYNAKLRKLRDKYIG